MSVAVLHDLKLFFPEVTLVTLLVLLFGFDAALPRVRISFFSLVMSLVFCTLAAWGAWRLSSVPAASYFSGLIAHDRFAIFFRYVFLFACAATLYLAFGSREVKANQRIEYVLLTICITFGLCVMAGARNLLLLYIAMETVTIVSFALAGFHRDNLRSNEASLKYLIYGGVSSALMIYGFSLLYGCAGSLQYGALNTYFAQAFTVPRIAHIGLLLVYVGFAFKISAFPMHLWTPDVYEGAPTPVATFFSVGPKAAGFAALMRFLIEVLSVKGAGAHQLKFVDGVPVMAALAGLSAVTMLVGNLSALAQTSVKRMMAYSSIAHVGYMLMGLVGLSSQGVEAVLFYIVVYCAMNLGAFWIVNLVSDLRGSDDIESFKGIGWTHPFMGTCMAIFLFSLTGIPVFAGFVGKFLLFAAVLKAPGFLWLAIFGVLNSVVSLYYYAKVVKAMWLDRPSEQVSAGFPKKLTVYHAFGLCVLVIPTLLFGLFFSPVLKLAKASVENHFL